MHFIGRLLSSLLLKVSLSALIMSSTILYLVSSPAILKSSLKEADVYNDIVPAVFESIQNDQNLSPEPSAAQSNTFFSDPAVTEIVRSSVDPVILQTQVDGAIESFADWLHSDADRLQFVMNFQPVKDDLTQNLAAYALARTDSLPICTTSDVHDVDQDPLSLQCRPADLTTDAAEQKIRAELAEIDFTITEATFEKDGQGSLESRLSELKNGFGWLKTTVFATFVLTLLAGAVYLIAHRPFKKALYGLGRSLLGSGLMVLVPAGLAVLIAPRMLARAAEGQKALAEVGLSFASVYATKVLMILVFWGVVLSVTGIIVICIDRKVIAKDGTRES